MNQEHSPTVQSYAIGFGLSIILTMAAFVSVTADIVDGSALIVTLLGLAVIQLYVQVVYFLHLGAGAKARWNLLAFLFMLMVVVIVCVGSIWIMKNLDYGHDHSGNELKTQQQVNDYIKHDEMTHD